VVLTAVGALLAAAGRATAQGGSHRIPYPSSPVDLPVGVCDFPVHVEPVVNNQYIVKQTTNPDGSITFRATGHLVVTATNTATGKTISVNASGPGTATLRADNAGAVFDVQGHFFEWLFPMEQARTGFPGLMLMDGHTQGTLDSDFLVRSLSSTGHITNLCAELT
jgi:hypothetical protein